jgi:hypothetical protein
MIIGLLKNSPFVVIAELSFHKSCKIQKQINIQMNTDISHIITNIHFRELIDLHHQ